MLGKIRLEANKVTQSYLYKIITIIEETDSPRHKKSYVEEELTATWLICKIKRLSKVTLDSTTGLSDKTECFQQSKCALSSISKSETNTSCTD
jgi:hypothetical protein